MQQAWIAFGALEAVLEDLECGVGEVAVCHRYGLVGAQDEGAVVDVGDVEVGDEVDDLVPVAELLVDLAEDDEREWLDRLVRVVFGEQSSA